MLPGPEAAVGGRFPPELTGFVKEKDLNSWPRICFSLGYQAAAKW